MTFNKTKFLISIFLMCCSFTLFPQDGGLDLSLAPEISSVARKTSFSAALRLDGWWNVPFGKNGSLFEGSAHTGVSFATGTESNTTVFNYDIDRFRFLFVIPTPTENLQRLHVELGRLPFQDTTSLILSHPADGAKLSLTYDKFNISIQSGYTGFIMRNNNSISLSVYDQHIASDKSSLFGSRRLFTIGEISGLTFFGQSINLSFIAQQDLNPEDKLISEWATEETDGSQGGKFNSQYLNLYINGSIPRLADLYYSTWFSYGTGRTLTWLEDSTSPDQYSYQYAPIQSMMLGFSINYYLQSFYNSAFNARFVYASGDKNNSNVIEGNTTEKAKQFTPITGSSFGLVCSPLLSNLIVAELGGSLKPIEGESLQTGAKLFGFFRPTSGPLSLAGLKPGSDSSFLGFELDFYGNYRIFSDLGVSLNTGFFFPNSSSRGAFDKKAAGSVQYSIQLSCVLSM